MKELIIISGMVLAFYVFTFAVFFAFAKYKRFRRKINTTKWKRVIATYSGFFTLITTVLYFALSLGFTENNNSSDDLTIYISTIVAPLCIAFLFYLIGEYNQEIQKHTESPVDGYNDLKEFITRENQSLKKQLTNLENSLNISGQQNSQTQTTANFRKKNKKRK